MLPKITLTSDQLIIYMAQVPTTHSLAFVDITDAQINAYIAAHGRHEHFEKTCYKLSYQLSEDDQISKYGTLAALTKWMVPALCPKVTPASNKESRVTQLAAGLYLGPAPTGPTSFTHDTHTLVINVHQHFVPQPPDCLKGKSAEILIIMQFIGPLF